MSSLFMISQVVVNCVHGSAEGFLAVWQHHWLHPEKLYIPLGQITHFQYVSIIYNIGMGQKLEPRGAA